MVIFEEAGGMVVGKENKEGSWVLLSRVLISWLMMGDALCDLSFFELEYELKLRKVSCQEKVNDI